ncbi:hypothetical protein HWV07_09835 [Natronomonas salina]|uniref:hypothetical protein n=1 Tax=Natronomonas salina TaxID=1710540 RepID=UPI0015B50AD5|nr:hypothetical protein [Natronomonas salina]QLD89311.1 hypothetical protein HWV07_09835 [Natronomonas salina]
MGFTGAALKFTGLIVVLTTLGMIIEGDVEGVNQSMATIKAIVTGVSSLGETTLGILAMVVFLGVLYYADGS